MNGRRKIEWYAVSPLAFGDVITPPAGETEGSVYRGWQGQNFLYQIAKLFVDGIEKIKEKFQPEIQGEEIAKLAGNLLAQIPTAVERFLKPIALGYGLSQGKIYRLLNPQSDSVAALERQQLQQYLKTLDGKERLRIFEEATDSGNDKIVSAFVQSSEIYNLLGKEILDAGRQKWLSKKDPLLALEFSENERAGSILAKNFENVIQDLAAYAQTEPTQIRAILDSLPTKADWHHQQSANGRVIDYNNLSSALPPPSQKL